MHANKRNYNPKRNDNEKSDNKSQPKTSDACHYCNIKGHYARDCHKKKADLAAKPQNKSVNSVDDTCYVTLQLNGEIHDLMVDTGAKVSVLPSTLFDAVLETTHDNLTVADGRDVHAHGEISVNVKTLDGIHLADHNFVVADLKKCYLGYDLIKILRSCVNSDTNELITIDGVRIPMHPYEANVSSASFPVLNEIDFDDVVFLTDGVPESAVPASTNIDVNVENLLDKYDSLFTGIGKTDLVQHFIETTDNVPVNLPPYRLPVNLKEKASEKIEDYLEKNIIRPSKSEYCSPVVLVKKPDDDVRVTIDFRALNAKSKKDAFASPRIDDVIDKLHDACVFTKLDVRNAYHNIEIAEADKHKTAFRFDGKLYEWNRTPFGLSSAPATFNRLMSNLLHEFDDYCVGYFDDIVVYSRNVDEHWQQQYGRYCEAQGGTPVDLAEGGAKQEQAGDKVHHKDLADYHGRGIENGQYREDKRRTPEPTEASNNASDKRHQGHNGDAEFSGWHRSVMLFYPF